MKAFCSKCKQECFCIISNFGIGPYAYGDIIGYDTHNVVLSNCHYEAVIDEQGKEITYPIYQENKRSLHGY